MASVKYAYSLQCCGDNSIISVYTSFNQLTETYYYDNNDICWSIVTPFQSATTAFTIGVPVYVSLVLNN